MSIAVLASFTLRRIRSANILRQIRSTTAGVATAICISAGFSSTTLAEKLGYPEKEELTFGFIKLTDMAPSRLLMKMAISKRKVSM